MQQQNAIIQDLQANIGNKHSLLDSQRVLKINIIIQNILREQKEKIENLESIIK